MVDTRLPCTTVHFLVSWMLRCNQADTSSWSDFLIEKRVFILPFLWNEKQLYPSHWWLVFSMVSEAASKTGADLVGHLYCSGSLRWTTLKFSSIYPKLSWTSIYITYFLLKTSRVRAASCTEPWFRHLLRQFWNKDPKYFAHIFHWEVESPFRFRVCDCLTNSTQETQC